MQRENIEAWGAGEPGQAFGFVRTTRRYRIVQIQAGARTINAADPLPAHLRDVPVLIHAEPGFR